MEYFLFFFLAAPWLILHALFLLWAARLLDIAGRSFGRALACNLLTGLIIVTLFRIATWPNPLEWIEPAIPFLVLAAAIALNGLLAMYLFQTTFKRAMGAVVIGVLLAWLISGGLLLATVMLGIMTLDQMHFWWLDVQPGWEAYI